MVTFDIAPNEALKETLSGKLTSFLIATSRTPVYWNTQEGHRKIIDRILRTGDTLFLSDRIAKHLKNELKEYRREYLDYTKKHLLEDEALLGGFSIYLYDTKQDEYVTYSLKVEGIVIDESFFETVSRYKKHTTEMRARFDIAVHDLFEKLAVFHLGGRFEPIGKEEYFKEFEYGGENAKQ